MKVAFASTDQEHIDEHFGWAQSFIIWDIEPETARCAGVVAVEGNGEGEDDRIMARLAALGDSTMVYVTQIGGPAAARLVARKIHPVKTKGNETIAEVVAKLQQVMRDNPPPWMRRAMHLGMRPAPEAE